MLEQPGSGAGINLKFFWFINQTIAKLLICP